MLPKITQILFYCGIVLLCLFNGNASAGQTTRISVASNGKQGNAASFSPSMSADGRYVAFLSDANNLVQGDTNNVRDIFVHDRETHKTEVIAAPISRSAPVLSANGRYIVFLAFDEYVFVYDRQTGKNENVAAQYRYATDLAISTDGRFISFVKRLEDGSHHLSNAGEVLIHDRVNNKTIRVDVTANGTPGNGLSTQPNFSADGRYIAFSSGSSNLIAGDSNGFWDIFVYDSLTRKTERVSIASNGNPANGSSYRPSLSANGRYVAFTSYADNLVAGDNNTVEDIFIHDRVTHKTERVDNSPKDLSDLGYSFSADAHFIAFYSRRLMDGQITSNDVYLYNRVTHRSGKMRIGALGSSQSSAPSLNADGRYMALMSDATNLVARDTNRVADIFVHDRLLDTAHRADLKIIATQKPTNLKPNSQGNYFYTLINKGKDTATDISLLHMISGGSLVRVKPSQGNCYFSTVETVCHLGELNAGKKLTLLIGGKAQNGTFSQQVTVSSAPWDVEPINNHIAVSTPVR
jgi:Tol biopolymer transport system component